MASLMLSARIVMPMFLLMGVGLLLRRWGLLAGKTLDDLNNLCFRLFLPASLFLNVYRTNLAYLTQPGFLLFALVLQLGVLGLILLVVPRLIRDNPARGSTAQAIFRTNFILFGLIIAAEFASGPELGVVSVLAAVMIPLYNIGGVLILERYRSGRPSIQRLLRQVATNPFVVSYLLGFALLVLGIRLPQPVEKAVGDLAAVGSPLSLLALGAWFRPRSLGRYRWPLVVGVVGRLLVVPALCLPLCILAGFRGVELLGLTCMLIAPTAVATFNMAQQMEADGDLACLLVITQSACALVTMFFWIFLLSSLGYLVPI